MNNSTHISDIDRDICAWKKCKQGSELFFASIPLCDKHWEEVCNKNLRTFKKTIKSR